MANRALKDFSDYLEITKDHHQGPPTNKNNDDNVEDDDDDDDGEVFKLTDGYSLASLKVIKISYLFK